MAIVRADERGRRPRLLERSLPLAILLALLLVVAGISGSRRDGVRTSPDISSTMGDYLFTALVMAYAIAGVVAIAMLVVGVRFRGRWETPPSSLHTLVTLLVFFGIAGLLTLAIHRAPDRPPPADDNPTARGELRPEDERARRTDPARFRWEVPAALAGLGGAALGAYALRRRRGDVLHTPVHEEVAAVLDETLDDLRSEHDFRRAVVAAYARLEQVLARHGTARREAEAPYEYLARMLSELNVSAAAARRLTELFERAKFSPHAIDERMKHDAIDALVSVRDELRAAS